jgi:hypothetical protein
MENSAELNKTTNAQLATKAEISVRQLDDALFIFFAESSSPNRKLLALPAVGFLRVFWFSLNYSGTNVVK